MTVLANFILHISDLILLHIIKVQGNHTGNQHAHTAVINFTNLQDHLFMEN